MDIVWPDSAGVVFLGFLFLYSELLSSERKCE